MRNVEEPLLIRLAHTPHLIEQQAVGDVLHDRDKAAAVDVVDRGEEVAVIFAADGFPPDGVGLEFQTETRRGHLEVWENLDKVCSLLHKYVLL